jgi:hypothetical protein
MGPSGLGLWSLSTAINPAPTPTHAVREPAVRLVRMVQRLPSRRWRVHVALRHTTVIRGRSRLAYRDNAIGEVLGGHPDSVATSPDGVNRH